VLLGLSLAAIIVVCALLLSLGDLRAQAAHTIGLLLLGSVAYGAACWSLARGWTHWSGPQRRRVMYTVVVIALAMRAILLLAPPSLSDDIYRYRWDGRVQAAGINPYVEPPAATRLAPLRDEYWNRINYPRIRSIYPPLAQLLFATTYRAHHSIAAFQLLAALGDLFVLGLIGLLIRQWRQPGWLLALYALHPLPALEFAGSGHYDAWTCAMVLAAILAAERHRHAASTALLAAGVLLKTWPLVFAPLMLRRRPRWHLGLFAVMIAGAYAPFASAGFAILQPWFDYTGRWRFNDGLFWALAQGTGAPAAGKAIAAGIGLGLLAWLWHCHADAVRGGYWLLLGFIVLMPTVHPWYLLWALPLAALARDRGWIMLCSLAPVAYWILVLNSGSSVVWVEPLWPRFVEYLPAAALWSAIALRHGAPYPGRTAPRQRPLPS